MTRVGRRTNSPPQFGHLLVSSDEHWLQNVHSKLQIMASSASAGRAFSHRTTLVAHLEHRPTLGMGKEPRCFMSTGRVRDSGTYSFRETVHRRQVDQASATPPATAQPAATIA